MQFQLEILIAWNVSMGILHGINVKNSETARCASFSTTCKCYALFVRPMCGKKWREGKHTLEDKIWKLESKSGTLYQKPQRKQNCTLYLTRNYPWPLKSNSPKCDKGWQVCICSTATYIGGGFFPIHPLHCAALELLPCHHWLRECALEFLRKNFFRTFCFLWVFTNSILSHKIQE